MDMLNKVELYGLGIIVNSDTLINGSYGIVIEDYFPLYYIIEYWTFEENKEVEMQSLSANNLRPATKEEKEEYMKKFNQYIAD